MVLSVEVISFCCGWNFEKEYLIELGDAVVAEWKGMMETMIANSVRLRRQPQVIYSMSDGIGKKGGNNQFGTRSI